MNLAEQLARLIKHLSPSSLESLQRIAPRCCSVMTEGNLGPTERRMMTNLHAGPDLTSEGSYLVVRRRETMHKHESIYVVSHTYLVSLTYGTCFLIPGDYDIKHPYQSGWLEKMIPLGK